MAKDIGIKEELKMKKIIIAIAALSAALSFTSCNKEEVVTGGSDIQPEAPVTVYATTGAMTKTSLSDGYQVLWSADDEIIFVSKSNPAKKAFFTLTDGVGKTSGTFKLKGETAPEDGDYIVYYPATYDGTNWPASQTYVEGNISGSPMKAEANVSGGKISDLKFQNAGGILRITVAQNTEVAIKKISFYAKELSSPVVLNCSSSVSLSSEAKTFHIAMPAKKYSEVKIFLTDSYDKTCRKSFKGTAGLVIGPSEIATASFSVDKNKFVAAGDILTFNGHEGIVVDLGTTLGMVIVATMNVGAESVNGSKCLGDKMKYDEACAACADWSGWHLPTVDELTAFCDPRYPGVCGNTEGAAGCYGAVMWDIDRDGEIDLYLPLNDYEETESGSYPCDKYWTGTAGNDGKYFYFVPEIDWDGWGGNTYYPIAYEDRELPYKAEADTDSEFLVRLFHDLP
ncbi:MAG: fimbrillin family protein [Bacteroidales bacterium]|nr:fimbrillin family protein [Bacteroidales bacterium]